MPTFIVVLEVRLHGSACGSTEDVIEAGDAAEAEAEAIRRWKQARPDRSYGPLLTVESASMTGRAAAIRAPGR